MTELAQWRAAVKLDQSFPYQRPKDAATLILIDRSGGEPKVLLGRRHRSHVFLPGKFVFPGGRVEPADRLMPVATPLAAATEARLMRRVTRPSPAKARGYALAAIRETFEEAGLLLGTKRDLPPPVPNELWRGFADAAVYPDLGAMHFIARAVTPPGRPKRFDTRFFAAELNMVAHRLDNVIGPDAELVELVWVPLVQARRLDMSAITSVVLDELGKRIAAAFPLDAPVPYYRVLRRRFVRELL